MSNMEKRSYIFPRIADLSHPPFAIEPDGWLRDRDGDGLADDCAVRFSVPGDATALPARFSGDLCDIAAHLGTLAVALPESITATPGDPTATTLTNDDAAELAIIVRQRHRQHSPSPITLGDLRDFWTIDGALVDDDGDLRPDGSRLRLRLPDPCPVELGLALVDLAARLGLETTGVSLPLLAQDDAALNAGDLLLDLSKEGEGSGVVSVNGDRVILSGSSEGKLAAVRELATIWPRLDASEPIAGYQDRLGPLLREIAFAETPAQRAALLASIVSEGTPDGELTLTTADPVELELARTALAPMGIAVAPGDMPGGFTLEWDAPWEVDDALAIAQGEAAPYLDGAGEAVELLILVSEPPAIRETMERELRQRFPRARVRVRSAYKAGLSWIEEDLIPGMQSLNHLDRVAISYPPFVGEGHLDLRIRWLQELYPGDELLADALGLPLDSISFEEGPVDHPGYLCRAYAGEQIIWESPFAPASITIPYVSVDPDAGQVVASTGVVRVTIDGAVRFERIIEPDPLRFWRWFQADVLPQVGAAMAAVWGAEPSSDDQPFFEALEINIWISEQDRPLGIREELDSPAEALHEDCYFGALDWLNAFAAQRGVPNVHGPGAIRPFVHIRTGRGPGATISFRPRRTHAAYLNQGDMQLIAPLLETGLPQHRVTRFAVGDAGLESVAIKLSCESTGDEARLVRLLSSASAAASRDADDIGLTFSFAGPDEAVTLPMPRRERDPLADQPAASAMPGWRAILFNDDVPPLLAMIRELPGVHIWQAERSYEGRPIWAFAITSNGLAGRWSPVKLSARKLTILIAARHHANEVSSTTAAFALAEQLQRHPELLELASIIVIPIENPDGVAFHGTLSASHSLWKHHPARYNAVGLEYGFHEFNRATRFGEARVRRETWERWRPQMVIDNHGVPSHEWSQHFSGFGSPPRFPVSYWVPQALLYGIVDHFAAPDAEQLTDEMRGAIAGKLASERDLAHINEILGDRYRRWGADREPDRFPASYDGSFLCYVRPHPFDPVSRNFGVRFPATTLLDWVTEVPDETAHGDRLEQTARCHLLANLTAIEALITQSGKGPRVLDG